MLWPQHFPTLEPKGDVSPEPQGPKLAAALTHQGRVEGHQCHLGTCQKCKSLDPTPDLLYQTPWGGVWVPARAPGHRCSPVSQWKDKRLGVSDTRTRLQACCLPAVGSCTTTFTSLSLVFASAEQGGPSLSRPGGVATPSGSGWGAPAGCGGPAAFTSSSPTQPCCMSPRVLPRRLT